MTQTEDETKRKLEIHREVFSGRLDWFVKNYSPDDPQGRYEFQMDLMKLFVDAMQFRGDVLGAGVGQWAAQALDNRALGVLHTIMKDPT